MARWRDIKNNRPEKPVEQKDQDSLSKPISLFIRFKAFIVDSFMITMPILYFVVYMVMGSGDNFSQNKAFGWSIIIALHALVMLSFLLIKKETPGMRAYGLKLISSIPDKKINIFQILIRYILTMPSIIILGLIPFFRKDRKMSHDLFSNTYFSLNDKNSSK